MHSQVGKKIITHLLRNTLKRATDIETYWPGNEAAGVFMLATRFGGIAVLGSGGHL